MKACGNLFCLGNQDMDSRLPASPIRGSLAARLAGYAIGLAGQQRLLARHAPAVARDIAVLPHHPMAGNGAANTPVSYTHLTLPTKA